MLYSDPLPESFSPGAHEVVVGKGKKYFNHSGNQMLRKLAASMIGEYANARTKVDKSLIISGVVERIRNSGGFVKFDQVSGRWHVAEELLCREKTSAVFRDALHDHKKSGSISSKKVIKRHREERILPAPLKKQKWDLPTPQPTTLFQGIELLQQNLNLGRIGMGDDDSLSGLTECFREEDLNFDDFALAEF